MGEVKTTDRIKVKVVGSGTPEDPFRVDLPAYTMIPGTEQYDAVEKKKLITVEVLVPDDECDAKGHLDKAKIRAKYKGQPRWDREDVLDNVV